MVLEDVCNLELTVTQKCIENTIIMYFYATPMKKMALKTAVERGLHNLNDQIREVRVHMKCPLSRSCTVHRSSNSGHQWPLIVVNEYQFCYSINKQIQYRPLWRHRCKDSYSLLLLYLWRQAFKEDQVHF